MGRRAERGGAVRTWAELGEALRHLRGRAGGRRGGGGLRGAPEGSGVRRAGSGLGGLCRASARAGDSPSAAPVSRSVMVKGARTPARGRRLCAAAVLVPFQCLPC